MIGSSDRSERRLRDVGAVLLLTAILVVGGYLRFTGLNWDEGQWIHPDEGHMRIITSAIEMPDRISLYFDTHNSPLNCRNGGQVYSYGTLPLFLTRATAEWLDQACGESPSGSRADAASAAIASLLMGTTDVNCNPGTFTGSRSAQVGRMLSALSDLGTVLLIYLIGRRLYGEAVGLLASALGALTAFSIQQAHFFTVDSMACFFITLTVYFSVRAGQTGSWASFGLAGLATGLAAACKIDGVLAALLVVLAAITLTPALSLGGRGSGTLTPAHSLSGRGSGTLTPTLSLEGRGENTQTPTLPRSLFFVLLRLVLAGVLCLVAFRVAQPYAFEGPGFFGVRLSPEWFGRLGQIRTEQSGEIDFPSGRQWTNRAPILFPWINMVFWGMGLPLGLTAWAGWAVAGWELWRGKRAHLVLWGWASLMFLYQSTRWVKAMRYSLPLYPIFVILAAYLVVRLVRLGNRTIRPYTCAWWRWGGLGLGAVVVAGTAFWASATFSIYVRSNTRVAASRWIYANVPEGTMLANEHWDWGLPLRVDGHDPFGGMYYGLEMENYNEDTLEKRAQLFAWLDQADYIFLASNRLYASIPRLTARYPLTIEYYRALFAEELGFELVADFTSSPALGPFQFPDQENPFPLVEADADTKHPYVHQTNPIKIYLPPAEEAFSVYDHPRVLIFRKTPAYSQQLVEEVLGGIDVERALHGLKPIEASAAPDALMFDPETWADQQAGGTWSEMFNRDGLLNRYPGLAAVAWWAVVTGLGWLAFPLLFAALPRLRDRGYGLARVLGLLLVAYLTWLAASLRVLPNMRGTILLMAVVLTLVGGGAGWRQRDGLRRFLRRRWRLALLIEGLFALLYVVWIGVRLLHPDLWHPVVGGEKPMNLAYLNAVLKSTWFPPYNPWFSGSKINYYYFGYVIIGVLIKLVGTVPAIAYNLAVPLLFALTGVGAFSVAYNLFGGHRRGALLAGMMALVFTVLLGNLGVVQLIRESLIRLGGEPFSSTIPGFPETVATLRGLWEVIAHGAKLPLRVESWYWHPTRIIPAAPGEVGPITEFPAFTFLYADLHAHMIAFPLTLLALALAVYWAHDPRPRWPSLLIGGLVIGALRPTNTWDYPTYLVLGLVGLAIGALGRTRGQGDRETGRQGDKETRGQGDEGTRGQGDKGVNGWATDKRMRVAGVGRFVGWLRAFGWRGVVLVGLTMVLYLPYIQNYAMGYSSFNVWRGSRTPFNIVLWILGILLFPLMTRLLVEVWRSERMEWRLKGRRRWPALVAGVGGVVGTTLVLVGLGYQVALVVIPVGMLAAYVVLAPESPASRRFLWFAVGSAMALCLGVEIIVLKGDIGRMNTVFKFYLQVWMLLSIAAAVSLAWVREYLGRWEPERRSEFIEERRLEPAGEARLELVERPRPELAEGPHPEIVEERRPELAKGSHPELVEGWRSLWWIGMGLLIFGGALFLPYGVRARAVDRIAPRAGLTLDGMAFMEYGTVFDGAPERGEGQEIPLSGDYAAIRWMQDHIQGSPVILEGLGYREYLWGNRVSIHTGLPAVIGWRWHQVQQRSGVLPETTVDWRREDVRECYDTTNVARALEILDRYGVRYVYVGAYERAYYDPAGLAKFDAMAAEGVLRVVYDAVGTKIYQTMKNDR